MKRRRLLELVDAGYIAAVSAAVAVVGQPRPLSLIVAGAGASTAAYIAIRTLDRGDRTP
jgi:hypothetical protein